MGTVLVMMAMGVEAGKKVILPSFTFMASAQAVLYAGAVPLFAEVRDDLTLDVDDLDALRVLVGELLDDAPFRAAEKDAAPAHFTHSCVRVLRETCAALAPPAGSHAGQR